MHGFQVFQSLWAMERRQTDGIERALPENIALIAGAGFDGVSAHYTDRAQVAALDRAMAGTGLGIEGVCFPRTVEDLRLPLELARDYPVRHITLQPDARAGSRTACRCSTAGWRWPRQPASPC